MICWEAWWRLEAMTEGERAHLASARAQALVTVARHLLDRLSQDMQVRASRRRLPPAAKAREPVLRRTDEA